MLENLSTAKTDIDCGAVITGFFSRLMTKIKLLQFIESGIEKMFTDRTDKTSNVTFFFPFNRVSY